MPDDDDPQRLLRQNGLLLLRRERELFAMRQAKARSAAWLEVCLQLSSEAGASGSPAAICAAWGRLLLGKLYFQIAFAAELEVARGAVAPLTWLHPAGVAPPAAMAPALVDYLCAKPSGRCNQAESAVEDALAAALGMARFLWFVGPLSDGRQLLLAAGFGRDNAQFCAPLDEDDATAFRLQGQHATMLVRTASLMNALEQRVQERTADLTQAHAKMLALSRQAGMAEIVVGVLHNVGNVLNSANVSAHILSEKLAASRVSRLREARGRLEDNTLTVAEVARYLEQLAEHLVGERDQLAEECQLLRRNLDHIAAVLAAQQSYARNLSVEEVVEVEEVVDTALSLCMLDRHDIEVERAYQPLPSLLLDRHRVTQILVNLFTNARDALHARGDARRIRVRVTGGERLAISVEDNGAGMAAEQLARVFQFGFTTKRSGHGFGVHDSANAARELGGALTCTSDGAGRCALFRLELPLRPAAGALSRRDRAGAPSPRSR